MTKKKELPQSGCVLISLGATKLPLHELYLIYNIAMAIYDPKVQVEPDSDTYADISKWFYLHYSPVYLLELGKDAISAHLPEYMEHMNQENPNNRLVYILPHKWRDHTELITEKPLLYDCGHYHKTFEEAQQCEKFKAGFTLGV